MKTEAENRLLLLKHEEREAVRKAAGLAEVFVDATGRFAADWIDEYVRKAVTGEHAHTLTLGADRLRQLKADLVAAKDAAPTEAKKSLNSLPWAFRGSETQSEANPYGRPHSPLAPRSARRAPEVVNNAVRPVLGAAGRILQTYGYPNFEGWKRSGGYRFPYGFDMSEEAIAALAAASSADVEVMELRGKIADLERQIGEARAIAAWDEV
jgi:hypothetical protein